MKLAIFEGTPEEIKRVWDGMNESSDRSEVVEAAIQTSNATNEVENGNEERSEYASVKFCRDVIGRRYVPETQRKMYRAAYAAYPDDLSNKQLEAELNYTSAQMAGFWGAFGRRISNTENAENEGVLFVDGVDGFKLSENLKKAIELEGLLK